MANKRSKISSAAWLGRGSSACAAWENNITFDHYRRASISSISFPEKNFQPNSSNPVPRGWQMITEQHLAEPLQGTFLLKQSDPG
jgi:hypothetical protein